MLVFGEHGLQGVCGSMVLGDTLNGSGFKLPNFSKI